MIANQIGQLNEDFELDQFPPPSIPNSNAQEQDLERPTNQDNARPPQDQPVDQLLDDHVRPLVEGVNK